jgi:ribosomal protein L35AE/L33A
MEMNLDTIADICYKERNEGNKLISVSIVVKDGNSGEIRVYNSNEYGGISEYNENQI